MAASPKTDRAAGSGRTTGSQRKTAGSQRKTAASSQKTTGSRQKSTSSQQKATAKKQEKGFYVYGILPAEAEVTSEMPGVGDPPGEIRLVHSDGLAALISEVDVSRPLGSPEDFAAHKEILDASAAELPVLPLRFGAVLASEDAVAEELLQAHNDEFLAALEELDGRIQFVVKGRYAEQAILAEVLSDNPQAARLRDQIHGLDENATRDARIQLGEIINEAVTVKRKQDTQALGEAIEGHCVASVVREPTHELDAVHVAFLVEADAENDMEEVVEDLARDWEGRVELRLLGPMAAYDFVGTAEPEG